MLATASSLFFAMGCGPTYPKCDNDEDCHEGEYCVNGQCQMCRTSSDCPTGQACNAGACEPISGFGTQTYSVTPESLAPPLPTVPP